MIDFQLDGGAPGGLGNQEQGFQVRLNPDFVPGHLIGPAAGVFGFRRGQPVGRFQFGALISGARRPGGQFLFVMFEIVIHAIQFAAQMLRLPGTDGSEIVGQVRLKGGAEEFPPGGQVRRRPIHAAIHMTDGLSEIDGARE